ncbi:MAG TPA: hypothetical protein VKE49_12935 [Myxococcaceae bacterium]|nr:hypothetical protein [Myxococcaceae bacterium]
MDRDSQQVLRAKMAANIFAAMLQVHQAEALAKPSVQNAAPEVLRKKALEHADAILKLVSETQPPR